MVVQILDSADIIFTLRWSRGAFSRILSSVISVNKTPPGIPQVENAKFFLSSSYLWNFLLLFNCFAVAVVFGALI